DSLGTAGVDVNPVPVPAAVWMLGSGLVGLMGIRRKADHGLPERTNTN
ncbi:MAG: VPLPA-CTERM sorting domain-containing protein, partial [Desulfobulbaceae bacterium]|nr:VPLPA-CTERM sorting domain-containing protein [Desulfobulbaceae bacterium]